MFGAAAVVVGLYVVLWGKAKDFGDDNNTIIPISIDDEPAILDHEANITKPLLHRKLKDENLDCVLVA